ncbi:Gfo/Idh/MocA family oxidoreductase [Georgenia sp. MJ173]|uniref:Gfo/Idh/MocA family oxidoreductase n=1 Tax=Georgenia sunbinii TaxID=3117728 RepID=UPI002F25F1D8
MRDGVVGEPLLVHNVHRNARPHPDATTEGVVANSMVHELDTLPWLLGSQVVEVQVRSPRGGRLGGAGLRDPQLATVELASGVLATIEVFLSAGYGYDVRCEVVGDRGAVSLGAPGHLAVAADGLTGTPVPADFRARFAEAYRDELVAWVDAAGRGGTVGASAWDGHRANLAAAAGIASLRRGGAVRVDDGDRAVPAIYG